MSHFSVVVILPIDTSDVEAKVTELLAPYDENGEWFREETEDRPASKWDWWQIGGRWTGCLTGDYDPETDPDNLEECNLCSGTGKRTDMEIPNGCNGCSGNGIRLKWPTDWKHYSGDVAPVEKAKPSMVHSVVTPDGKWHEQGQMGWFGVTLGEPKDEEVWTKEVQAIFDSHPGHLAAMIDAHV